MLSSTHTYKKNGGNLHTTPNFLDEETCNYILSELTCYRYPWYFGPTVASLESSDGFMFGHKFYDEGNRGSDGFDRIIKPIIDKAGITEARLLRAKANLYTNQGKAIVHDYHIDMSVHGERYKNPSGILLYNLTTNNGYTEMITGEKFPSNRNEAIFFDQTIEHRSVTQTDTDTRINININYEYPNSPSTE